MIKRLTITKLTNTCVCMQSLRKAIADVVYPSMGIRDTEVFISDGAQCDIARLHVQQNYHYYWFPRTVKLNSSAFPKKESHLVSSCDADDVRA